MNHIRRMQAENAALQKQLEHVASEIVALRGYYLSDKFREHDFAHVRTDILPRLNDLYSLATRWES